MRDCCELCNETSGFIKCGGVLLTNRGPLRFSRRTLLHGEVVLNFYLLFYFQGPG